MRRFASLLVWLACVVLAIASLAHCVSDAGSPVITTDGGTIVDEASVVGGRHDVGGTVSGLPANGTVTLTLNGGGAQDAKNGPFVFPSAVLSGQAYLVEVTKSPAKFVCKAANGSGTATDANVTNIVVTCTSSDSTLTALSLSGGPLTPGFMPGHLAYAAHVSIGGTYLVSTSTTSTVTATPTDPNAKITVNGAPTMAAKASAPITMNQGPQTIDVVVTASDGVTQSHYTIAAFTAAADYIKASNTTTFYDFGKAVALSADGKTLAVGSDRDGGDSSGINGKQTKGTSVDTTFSGAVYVFTKTAAGWAQQAYVKASNNLAHNFFGTSVALSSDGNTMAIGAVREGSKATGINGDQTDTSQGNAGAVYVFVRSGTTWTQQAYVKASNTRSGGGFGSAVSLSSDGNTLAVGSYGESSASTGVNQSQADGGMGGTGAAYVFTRTGTTWTQEAYIKASNTRVNALFGCSIALSGDSNTLAVGSYGETSSATTIGGSQADGALMNAGAVYVFLRTTGVWAQQAYVKATNTAAMSSFGTSVALSSDGNTMAVGETGDSSNATGINGNALDTSATDAGSVFVYSRSGATWSQQAYVKTQVTHTNMVFGVSVAFTPDGNTLAVGALDEASASIGLGGNPNDTSAMFSGAAYEFKRAGTTWSQAAYIKSPNTQKAYFGYSVALAADGKTLAVSAVNDSSNATGVNGDENDTSAGDSGAVHVF